ncbi:MAG TPA: N-acetylmuramoyl-L-alanine amidase [Rubricoccaceae bacterium]|nr:N-acetylmuramoyl-L-alanine amidase [Rubricoccaceae bacterium]
MLDFVGTRSALLVVCLAPLLANTACAGSLEAGPVGWGGGREGAPPAVSEASIARVSFTARADGRGYVVRLHADGRIGAYSVDRPSPEVVELVVFRARLAPDLRRDEAAGPVRSYRVVPADDRITFTFQLAPTPALQAQAYPDRDSDDLLLALTTAPAPSAPVAQAATGGGGGTAGAAVGQEHWRLDCVVIDAGHGGHDGGATYNGVREKDVALGIARRLGTLIQDRLGVRVVYTRSDDRFITLDERGRMANRSCGKLFISIHANAAGNESAHGAETYFLAPHRTASAREVMERENSVVALESDPGLYADFDAEGGIMRALAFSAYQQESQTLAALIQEELGGAAGRTSRGVKQAGFLVLWRASMPAVLVETGFVSNDDEARYLASAAGQEAIAGAIYRAVRAYKERYERDLRLSIRN